LQGRPTACARLLKLRIGQLASRSSDFHGWICPQRDLDSLRQGQLLSWLRQPWSRLGVRYCEKWSSTYENEQAQRKSCELLQ
jgi:hypothetical protein